MRYNKMAIDAIIFLKEYINNSYYIQNQSKIMKSRIINELEEALVDGISEFQTFYKGSKSLQNLDSIIMIMDTKNINTFKEIMYTESSLSLKDSKYAHIMQHMKWPKRFNGAAVENFINSILDKANEEHIDIDESDLDGHMAVDMQDAMNLMLKIDMEDSKDAFVGMYGFKNYTTGKICVIHIIDKNILNKISDTEEEMYMGMLFDYGELDDSVFLSEIIYRHCDYHGKDTIKRFKYHTKLGTRFSDFCMNQYYKLNTTKFKIHEKPTLYSRINKYLNKKLRDIDINSFYNIGDIIYDMNQEGIEVIRLDEKDINNFTTSWMKK